MADDIFTKAMKKVEEATAALAKAQSFVNQLDEFEGRPLSFPNVGDITGPTGGARIPVQKKWQPGDFFGKSFSGACRMMLLARYEANGSIPSPASVDDIHEALSIGSFKFEGSGAETQKNSIRISLGKNSQTFVRLPGTDLFGLVEWYGAGAKKARRSSAAKESSVTDTAEEASDSLDDPDLPDVLG